MNVSSVSNMRDVVLRTRSQDRTIQDLRDENCEASGDAWIRARGDWSGGAWLLDRVSDGASVMGAVEGESRVWPKNLPVWWRESLVLETFGEGVRKQGVENTSFLDVLRSKAAQVRRRGLADGSQERLALDASVRSLV